MFTRSLSLRSRAPLDSARHDWVVLGTVIAAVVLLIGNGTSFFRELDRAQAILGPGAQVAAIALTLNVALILFGWRRYVDLQHETEMRREGDVVWDETMNEHWMEVDGKIACAFSSAGGWGGGMELACQSILTVLMNFGFLVFGVTDYSGKKMTLRP